MRSEVGWWERLAMVVCVAWLGAAGVSAQQDAQASPSSSGGHAMGMDGMQGMSCMAGAGEMHGLVESMAAEVEKARQANDPTAMRAALESVQSGLSRMREHTRACAGMSKMHGMSGMSPGSGGAADPHAGHTATSGAAVQAREAPEAKSEWTIRITSTSYEPESVVVKAGVKARLTFIRTTEQTCATEVVFPDFNIEKALPLNEPVVVEITPTKAGEFRFTCGMNMYNGKMVVN